MELFFCFGRIAVMVPRYRVKLTDEERVYLDGLTKRRVVINI
jgi:hypothetical protein